MIFGVWILHSEGSLGDFYGMVIRLEGQRVYMTARRKEIYKASRTEKIQAMIGKFPEKSNRSRYFFSHL